MNNERQKTDSLLHNQQKDTQISRFHLYLTKEIGIEFKACLYFFAILFFYSVYRIFQGSWEASIIHMAEMITATYIMGYMQVFLFSNFDEAEHLGIREVGYSFVCTMIYVAVSALCNWFNRDASTTFYFFVYILVCYVCVLWIYKIKRDVDTKKLNQALDVLKERRRKHEGSH